MHASAQKPTGAALVAVGLVAGATLAYQVVLTRLFSAVLPYHFSFLAISIALLGTGGGALFVYVWRERFATHPLESLLIRWCQVFALLLIAVPLCLVRLDYAHTGISFASSLTTACALAALPPFAAGVLITLAISGYTRWVGTVYAFDLLGAGLGAIAVVPTLWLLPAPTLVVGLGSVVGIAAVLFATGFAERSRGGLTIVALGCALMVLSTRTSVLYLPTGYPVGAETLTVSERWTPLARVFGFERPASPRGPHMAAVFYDRVYAPVPIVGNGAPPRWDSLKTGPQSIGYEVSGPGRALIIGGGGGRDIYNALSSAQQPVDVIELNEGIRRVVDEDLGYLSGSPYSRPGVNTTIGDGRSVLAARDTRYDQIHIGFTDTLSANAAQGFALTENNLYTVEAFLEYLDHLTANGVLNLSRPLKLVGEEALRITVLALAALDRYGVEDPQRHVVVVLGRDWLGPLNGTVLARLTPYTDAEIDMIRRLAQERGQGIAFAPGGPYLREWKELTEAASLEDFCRGYRLNVCPPTDDQPFFFSMQRLNRLWEPSAGALYTADPFSILILTLAVLVVLSLAAFVLPLTMIRGARPDWAALVYFGAIGLGFLLMEIVLIQRFVLFLGYPTYALSVVLFSLLVFTGVGSSLSERFANSRRALITALTIASVLIAASAFGLQPLLRHLIDLPFAARAVLAVAMLVPFGLTLGMAMPIGLRRFEGMYPAAVPYAWGVNGVASVLASVLGMAFAIQFGFAATSILACSCYVVALSHAVLGRWPPAAF